VSLYARLSLSLHQREARALKITAGESDPGVPKREEDAVGR